MRKWDTVWIGSGSSGERGGEGTITRRYTRLTTPYVRDGGELRRAGWDEALDRAAAGFRKALADGDGIGLFSCSKATNELNYATQKLSRVAFASNNIDSCNRT